MKARWRKYTLKFKIPGGTSRGVLREKDAYFIVVEDQGQIGIGECGILRGLSADDVPDFEEKLQWACDHIALDWPTLKEELIHFPSIVFALEQVFRGMTSSDPFHFFDSPFTRGERGQNINGLIWMGDRSFMEEQIARKLEEGFHCLKMKIGALDWETEKQVLTAIRERYTPEQIELRVDANGAFTHQNVHAVLDELAALEIHSIEQPIKKGQWQEMAELCEKTPIPIALDEELIGIFNIEQQQKLMDTIAPQYIILKPSFIGGWSGTDQWIALADKSRAGWWVTSALESNVGLNAIAQYTASKEVEMPQGLGTGSLFTNNMSSPLSVSKGKIKMSGPDQWDSSQITLL